ncbi:MAG: HD domain-containing protein [Acidobacteria bacterium]|nr:HD domain-containing protein [Acidobacteriota bacterium]
MANWRPENPLRFACYLAVSLALWWFQKTRPALAGSFPLTLPVVLLAVVSLSVPEALLLGCTVALVQNWRSLGGLDGRLHLCYFVGVQALMISFARYASDTLVPSGKNGSPIQLLIAAVALFVANTLPAAIIERLAGGARLGQLWHASYGWALPHYLVAAAGAHLFRLGPSSISWDTALLALTVITLAFRHHQMRQSELRAQQKHAGDLALLHMRAIEGMALAVEAKENSNIAGHLRRVRIYALGVGRAMNMSPTELEALHAAALLHDIGKLAVPDHILSKPGRLTAEEFAKLKVHTLVGAEIVEHMQFPYPVSPLVRSHHEKWDGTGYPFGLKGEAIPLGARILSAVDCLDALSSDREYRKGLPLKSAVKYVAGEAGKSFDPAVTQVIEEVWQQLDSEVHSSDRKPLLSTNTRIDNGQAPAAGLDTIGSAPAAGAGFISTIAAARKEERRLREIETALGGSLNTEESFARLTTLLRGLLPFDAIALFIREAGVFRAHFADGEDSSSLLNLEIENGAGLTGWVAQHAQAVVNGNPSVDPGFPAQAGALLESALSFPLSGANGVFAVLNLYRRRKDAFFRDDLRILTAIGPRVASALSNAMAYREMESLTQVDPATGLPNRSGIQRRIGEELSRCRRTHTPLAVAVIRLRPSEHSLDPKAESGRLAAIGRAFRQDCRDYDEVGYLGSNTFAVVLPGMKVSNLSDKFASLLRAAGTTLEEFRSAGVEAGSAFYPDDADDARQLLVIAARRITEHSAFIAGLQALHEKTRSAAKPAQTVPHPQG